MKNAFKLSNAIYPPLNPLPLRRGDLNAPSPLEGEGWGEGE